MAKPKNTKRKTTTRKTTKPKESRSKKIAVVLILGAISAFGLWRLFDTDKSPLDPATEISPFTPIDMGKNKTPDPTLVNEATLLREEENLKPPKEKFTPKEAAESSKNKDIVSIEEAGKDIKEGAEEDSYPLYAVAYHFHTQIKAEPKSNAQVISYARRGSTFKVSNRVSTRGCKRGWHEVAGGGFICDGSGVNVSKKPVTFAPAPPKPRLNSPLPYKYMYAKTDDTPEFWRLPTQNEINETNQIFNRISSRSNQAKQLAADPTETIKKEDKDALAAVLAKASKIARETYVDAGVLVVAKSEPIAESAPKPTILADGGIVDPYAIPAYVHLKMAKGYFVSIDDVVSGENSTFWRTVRGRFIPKDKMYLAKASSFEGVLLNNRNKLPLTFVVGGGVKKLIREKDSGPFKVGKRVERYTMLPMFGEVKRKNKRYIKVGKNEFLSSRVVAIAKVSTPPKDLQEGERWIDINLSQQTLIAYEGETPVFATLISSGRKDFDTPEGEFRIYNKHITITMDDPNGGEEAYSIEDVPWTQYFDEGYALHAAFWHNRFGKVRSHGCINLTPPDARRLFFWTGPHLPAGIHGIVSNRENPGTRIVIHK